MFARNVSIRLKPGKLNEFTRTFDKEVLSILRKQPGFRDEIIFTSPGETELTALSLWDSKAQADAYNASAYPKVLQAVHAMLDGTPKVPNLNVTSSTMQHTGSGSGKAASASTGAGARGGEMTSTTENKEIARRFMEECWNKGDKDAMCNLIADNCSYHDPVFPGVESLPQHIASCRSGFPDLHFSIEDMIGERNEVVVHWTAHGTHKGPFLGMQPTKRTCTGSGSSR